MNIDKIIDIAKEEACKSSHKARMGCVIFNKKTIISKSYNSALKSRKKLHPKYQKWDYSVHAELDAIIKARHDLKGCSLLIVRLNKNNELRMSKPCHHCMKYIEHVGIKNIFYTDNEGRLNITLL